jgi:hypothetical protein
MKRYYFAYGMNTNLKEMSDRCPLAINLGKCTLKNYELKFRHHADIDYKYGSEMEGVLWDITFDCEKALDSLEGYPFYYDKIEVVVNPIETINTMTHIIAMAYTMTSKGVEQLPSTHYEKCLMEGYLENGLDVDKLTKKIDELIINTDAYI